MKALTVGIIGIDEDRGILLTRFFEHHGCRVVGTDVGTELSPQQVVKQADVVIALVYFTDAQIAAYLEANLIQFSRSDQLWISMTPSRSPVVDAMLKSKSSVVCVTPMEPLPKIGGTLWDQILSCSKVRIDPTWDIWLSYLMSSLHEYARKNRSYMK